MNQLLFESAAAGATVLTANKRLARHLLRHFDRCQIAAGLKAWPTPTILSLEGWLLRLLQQLRRDSTLLTEVEARRIWEGIVAADAAVAGRDLLQVPQAAQRAREAHLLLSAYLAEFSPAQADEDHLAFVRWRQAWLERQRRTQWIDRGELLAVITAALTTGQGAVSGQVLLAGFDELSPALQRLRAVLQQRGCRVDFWEPPPLSAGVPHAYAAVDMADEVRSCARWVRHRLERDPQARIGVVAANLEDYQGLIERIFRAELDPPACQQIQDNPETFTLSLGTPLAREGVIRAALNLLGGEDPWPLEAIGWLLRSPYLGGAGDEWLGRATADRVLRERGRRSWRLATLPKALAGVPRVARMFTVLHEARRDQRRRLPGDWAEHFAQLLESCGWPGDRPLASREFQAIQQLRAVLGQLAALDRVTPPMARGEALAIFTRLAAETVFQPEGGEGQVQVLGMLEAAGFGFDALWVLGLHDGAFPAPPRPNPFLPLGVQSRLRMPHADVARQREFAEHLAGRLWVAAPAVVVSWPGQRDGVSLRPSPLLGDLPAATLELAPSCDPFRVLQAAPCPLETIVDDRAASLPADRLFSGGTRILADQALCPFRAFAHHRLHAKPLEAPDLGIDSRARGTLVHGVLERFWHQVRSRDALLQLDPQRLAELLAIAAEETLQHLERRSRSTIPERLRSLEAGRLVALATGWLALEARRPPFRIAAIEQSHVARVGRLQVRTRIDRIDELADGQLVVIDYKTGRPNPRQWLEPRVTEPQLPLYCLDLDPTRLAAVLFAVVRSRSRECAFLGVARDPEGWPQMSARSQERLLGERGWSNFDQVVDHWRVALPALGDDFVAGCAAVDPVDPQLACAYCDLVTLCRLNAEDLAGCDAGDEEGGDG